MANIYIFLVKYPLYRVKWGYITHGVCITHIALGARIYEIIYKIDPAFMVRRMKYGLKQTLLYCIYSSHDSE